MTRGRQRSSLIAAAETLAAAAVAAAATAATVVVAAAAAVCAPEVYRRIRRFHSGDFSGDWREHRLCRDERPHTASSP